MEDKEKAYDEHVSPLVQRLIEACQEHGVPMFCTFQFSQDGFCTSALSTGHPVIDHHRALSQCADGPGVNLDKYLVWVVKKVKEEGKGHNSIFLHQAGIPTEAR